MDSEDFEFEELGIAEAVGLAFHGVISAGLQNLFGAGAVGTNARAAVPSARRAKRGELATRRQSESRSSRQRDSGVREGRWGGYRPNGTEAGRQRWPGRERQGCPVAPPRSHIL